MAKILETENCGRRLIRLSSADILSVVRDYQRVVPRGCSLEDVISYLSEIVVFIPEDI